MVMRLSAAERDAELYLRRVKELEAEVERLRVDLTTMAERKGEAVREVHRLGTENERLRGELAGKAENPTYLADTTKFWRDKAERLQEEREDSLSRWNQIAESEAEVERLRALLRDVLDFADPNEPAVQHAREALAKEKE